MMRRGTALLLLCLLMPCCAGHAGPKPVGAGPLPTTEPAKVLASELWELRIWYRAKGTRSEGQHGELFFRGRRVTPSAAGDERDTSLGRLEYYGAKEGFPWEPTGWNFADRSKIRPSWADKKDSPSKRR